MIAHSSTSEKTIFLFQRTQNKNEQEDINFYRSEERNLGLDDLLTDSTITTPIYQKEPSEFIFSNEENYLDRSFLKSMLKDNYLERINRLSNLKNDWDSYGAPAPSTVSIKITQDVLNYLIDLNLIPDDILPNVEGGLSYIFSKKKKYATIDIHNDGDIIVGLSNLDVWKISNLQSLKESKIRIREFIG